MVANAIPVSVIVATLNEAQALPRCLNALKDFDEVIVVDSGSSDGTAGVARAHGAEVVLFVWNGRYPKKRQWSLDTLTLRHERVFFVDADEEVTPALVEEIRALDWRCAGYFVKGRNVWKGKPLRFGLMNNKLALLDRRKIEFPPVDDLDIPGMGEMEGHYQPVLKTACAGECIGQIAAPLLHHAFDGQEKWAQRHERYARWETEMIRRSAYPEDPVAWREALKKAFRRMPGRGIAVFLYAYFIKLGILDGFCGFFVAFLKYKYYTGM